MTFIKRFFYWEEAKDLQTFHKYFILYELVNLGEPLGTLFELKQMVSKSYSIFDVLISGPM